MEGTERPVERRGRRLYSLAMPMLAPILLLALAATPRPIGEAARERFDAARAEAQASAVRSKSLATQSQAASAQARAAAAALVRLAARVQAIERELIAVERRFARLDRERRDRRDRLAAAQDRVLPLVAALETMARRPIALALVQPGSAADLAHVRIALGQALPLLAARTADLRREVQAAEVLVRTLAAEQARRRAVRDRLAAERAQLARVAAAQRAAGGRLAAGATAAARRATTLAGDARSFGELLARLSRRAAGQRTEVRLQPPVAGEVVTRFGREGDTGLHAQGLTLAGVPGGQVVAPAAGRVAFAGPFRTYGRIAILEHGGGWLTLLAGLEEVAVKPGDIVPAGLPIGRLPGTSPDLYLELRRIGVPVDPEPRIVPPGT